MHLIKWGSSREDGGGSYSASPNSYHLLPILRSFSFSAIENVNILG